MPLRIWLLQIGEPVPLDPGPPRLLRTAILAEELARRGHEVVLWNARFDHQRKVLRPAHWDGTQLPQGYRLRLLEGRAYQRNVSVARIFSQIANARDFTRKSQGLPLPDVIVCGFPSIELADVGSQMAALHGIPLLVDCRDMWPDIIADSLPPLLRIPAAPLLAYWTRRKRKVMQAANAITGITEAFVSWGLAAAGRGRTTADQPFHLAIQADPPTADAAKAADQMWAGLLGPKVPGLLRLCFAGTLSRRLAIMPLVNAFRSQAFANLQLVLCGRGDLDAELTAAVAGHPNIFYAGWRSQAEVRSLMAMSDVGVLPYPNTRDFQASYPNKVGEYLSMGLPVMTSLGGMTGDLLGRHNVGLCHGDGEHGVLQALEQLNSNPVPDEARRARALQLYHSHFDPLSIYPRFADHVEAVATRFSHSPLAAPVGVVAPDMAGH